MSKTGPRVPKVPELGLCWRCPESEGPQELWHYGGSGKSGKDLCARHLAEAQRTRSNRYRSLLNKASASALSSNNTSGMMAASASTGAGALAARASNPAPPESRAASGETRPPPESRRDDDARERAVQTHRRSKALLLHKAFTKVSFVSLFV